MDIPSYGVQEVQATGSAMVPGAQAMLLDQRLADALDDLEDIHALLTWQQVTWEMDHLEQTPLSLAQEQRLKQALAAEKTSRYAVQEIQRLFLREHAGVKASKA